MPASQAGDVGSTPVTRTILIKFGINLLGIIK
jgi:hypothetical protein